MDPLSLSAAINIPTIGSVISLRGLIMVFTMGYMVFTYLWELHDIGIRHKHCVGIKPVAIITSIEIEIVIVISSDSLFVVRLSVNKVYRSLFTRWQCHR